MRYDVRDKGHVPGYVESCTYNGADARNVAVWVDTDTCEIGVYPHEVDADGNANLLQAHNMIPLFRKREPFDPIPWVSSETTILLTLKGKIEVVIGGERYVSPDYDPTKDPAVKFLPYAEEESAES